MILSRRSLSSLDIARPQRGASAAGYATAARMTARIVSNGRARYRSYSSWARSTAVRSLAASSGDVFSAVAGHHLQPEAGIAFGHGRILDQIGDHLQLGQPPARHARQRLVADENRNDRRRIADDCQSTAVSASRIWPTRFNSIRRSSRPRSDWTISNAFVTVADCTGESAFENVAEHP